MCQSWPLAWWKMRVWELKEILTAIPCAMSLLHTPLLAALPPDTCTDPIVYGAGNQVWAQGQFKKTGRKRGWDEGKEAACHYVPVSPRKPRRTKTTFCHGGERSRHLSERNVCNPRKGRVTSAALHKLRFVTLPCNEGSCVTFVRKDVTAYLPWGQPAHR